jgi:two-component system chemotaxis sensor kinase CheA
MFCEDQAILDAFVVESKEHLCEVESLLLAMEASSAQGDQEAINSVFRAIHSIKGGAGFLGLAKVNDLSHAAENVLNRMRLQELNVTSDLIDLLLRATDMLRCLMETSMTRLISAH